MHRGKPFVQETLRGTLTSTISKSVPRARAGADDNIGGTDDLSAGWEEFDCFDGSPFRGCQA